MFRRSDDDAQSVGGDDGVGVGGGGGVVSGGHGHGEPSWDDSWDIHGGEAGTPSGTQLGAPAHLGGGGNGSGGAGVGGVGNGAEQVGEAGGGPEAHGDPEKQVKPQRPGEERAHKMWVTGGGAGDSVSGDRRQKRGCCW